MLKPFASFLATLSSGPIAEAILSRVPESTRRDLGFLREVFTQMPDVKDSAKGLAEGDLDGRIRRHRQRRLPLGVPAQGPPQTLSNGGGDTTQTCPSCGSLQTDRVVEENDAGEETILNRCFACDQSF